MEQDIAFVNTLSASLFNLSNTIKIERKNTSTFENRVWKNPNINGNFNIISNQSYEIYSISIEARESINFVLDTNEDEVFLLFSLKKDGLKLNVNTKKETLLRTEVAYIRSNTKSEYQFLNNEQVEVIVFSLKKQFFELPLIKLSIDELLHYFFNIDGGKLNRPFKVNENINKILTEIQLNKKQGECALLYINAKVLELITEVLETFMVLEELEEGKDEKLIKVKRIITENINIHYSIPELAKMIGMNESYLKKRFKDVFKETIFEYANKKRMHQAKILLSSSCLPISIISDRVGYQHASHFSYAFKKYIGDAPNKYRTDHK
ncbi:AraC family transcriptional regulator [Flammeovirga pectinis]|uniref:AraC family transcriptional regulator n=1 Tax=Flammeovirga pectinis TaxID=2494373 RepID=A0A3Q9FVJ5_9BACT|nr:AraC family transcriptional regulator [Flammeovirga pectinis]AZQ65411.1 AraC family transcriptional regulator [Flammeovirga pectinis]